MKRSIMFGVLFSTAVAVGAGAQSTGGQTPSQSGSSDQVTVTGCLQSGDAAGATGTSGAGSTGAPTGAGSTGAAGSSASGSRGGGFVLTNAKMGSGSASGGASSTGTAGSATGSSSSSAGMAGMTRFKLEGSQSDLQKYANSQVEITGKLDKSTGSGSSSTGSPTTGATGATGATGSGSSATGSASSSTPTLRVSNVRQVSPTCSGS